MFFTITRFRPGDSLWKDLESYETGKAAICSSWNAPAQRSFPACCVWKNCLFVCWQAKKTKCADWLTICLSACRRVIPNSYTVRRRRRLLCIVLLTSSRRCAVYLSLLSICLSAALLTKLRASSPTARSDWSLASITGLTCTYLHRTVVFLSRACVRVCVRWCVNRN